jgi:hypothetical protein
MAQSLIDQIKSKYPHPVSMRSIETTDPNWESYYCVGGALCQFVGIKSGNITTDGFPLSLYIAKALRELNPDLPDLSPPDQFEYVRGETIARQIMTLNDQGDIEGAWNKVREALEYTPEVPTDG